MKKYFALFSILGFFLTSSAMACPGSAQCNGANCQCQGNSCGQENPVSPKGKKAKNLKKPEPTPTVATPSNG
jgi:hypothetical protein